MLRPLEIGAMFPFLPEGREAATTYRVTVEDLVGAQQFGPARQKGTQRIRAALGGEFPIDKWVGAEDKGLVDEILGYLYARILVSAVNDPYLTTKFCLAEAKLFEARVKRLVGTAIESDSELGSDFERVTTYLGVPYEQAPAGRISFHFSEYLRLASSLDQKDWALATSDLRNGRVFLNRKEAIRLFEEAFRAKLLGELPLPLSEELYTQVSTAAEGLAGEVAQVRAKFEGGEGLIDEASFPPCISKLLEMTGTGQNVPHMGRFTLVAFLHTIGYDKEGMIALFSRWPDFNVQKSMYQIQHIIGETSGTEYTPPTCATMKTYGICYNPDKLCNYIRHPLSYYRVKIRDLVEAKRKLGEDGHEEKGGESDGDGKNVQVSD